MAEYDFKKIEKKWQKKWEGEKIFEAEVDKKKKKFFVSFPYPYVNLSPHIGHTYTSTRVEAFARYKRLRGFNVLFSQGWHATGSPIVAAANRVKEGEEKQIGLLKKEGFSDKEIKKFEKPEHWIEVFGKRWKDGFKELGFSIDWRRNFITTSLNPYYDKFIQWQFLKLKQGGYVEKGSHPVVWDPKTNMPVGDHDRVKGEGETPQEFCLFRFKLDDGKFLVSATLRPDTLFGITNVYVNPDLEYIEVMVDDEIWFVSKEAISKLENQDFNVKVLGEKKGLEFIGKKVETIVGNNVPVLPATFVDPNYGTGIVHSVPSESADDLIALRDLQKDDKTLGGYNLDKDEIKSIEPIAIFDNPEIKGFSSKFFLEKYNIKSQNEKEKLAKIREELYKFSFNKSKFNSKYKKGFSKNLEGVRVSEGQEIVKEDLLKQKKINLFYELTGEVVSRSLTPCLVKLVKDQWFIKYGDKKWKEKVHKLISNMKFYPEVVRSQFEYVIDWLKDWACTREYGLGTRLPFDEKWLIESLSDSTIYMAYYTISHLIKDLKPEELSEEFFDYIFLGKGKGKKEWKKFRESFGYWYPHDFRNSGKDLVQNHLTFFLFNHVAIFSEKSWPKSIGVNGWVKVDGQKMSKSLGNIIPVSGMVERFGADASRFTVLNGGEGLDDPNWDSNFAESLNGKFDSLFDLVNYYKKGRKEKNGVDKWMESMTHKIIKEVTSSMDETLFRSAAQKIFFDFGSVIRKYLLKTNNHPNKEVYDFAFKSFILMLHPICPHITEELWEKLGNKKLISLSEWPKVDEAKIDESLEKAEEAIEKLIQDINHVVKLVEGKTKVYVYVLPNEKENFVNNLDEIKKRTSLEIEIFAVNDKDKYDPENKSKKVKPGRPGIYLE
ncbi:MAG: leucine--tRNA ligase [Candidatus Pacearchaeota archaeon]|jgi:leucyl-tRNA synthetase